MSKNGLQIFEVEEVTAAQLLQLVRGMSSAIQVAENAEAAALRRHEALSAAGRALRGLYFREVSDEVRSFFFPNSLPSLPYRPQHPFSMSSSSVVLVGG